MNRAQAESPRRCSVQRASVLSPGDQTDCALAPAWCCWAWRGGISQPLLSGDVASPTPLAFRIPVLVRWEVEAFGR